jgi:hypothetical protein
MNNRNPLLIYNGRSETPSVIVAHIAGAADTANEIATDSATPWTFFIGSHYYHLTLQPEAGATDLLVAV